MHDELLRPSRLSHLPHHLQLTNRLRYDNIRPASPAMTRALVMIQRSFSNPWGREKSMSRTMLKLGPRHEAARARYRDIATTMARQRFGLADAIRHLRFAYKLDVNRYNRARYLECLMLLRWLRLNNPHGYYAIRDALTQPPPRGSGGQASTSTITPRSW